MIIQNKHQLYKGVFWITDLDDIDRNENYCFKIPSDRFGNVVSDGLDLNAKSGTTYNHEKLWRSLPRKITQGKPFDYFPRGRIEIKNGKATIYLNPLINTEEIQRFLIDKFNLTEANGIDKTVFSSDWSEHYKCFLDNN